MAERTVRCPQCGGDVLFSPANPHRPFCSDRCRLIDLGCWANDSYRVPVVEKNDGELPEGLPPTA